MSSQFVEFVCCIYPQVPLEDMQYLRVIKKPQHSPI